MTTAAVDTTLLSSFARAREVELLARIMSNLTVVTTRAVLDEIVAGIAKYPELATVSALPWIQIVELDGLATMSVFAQYARVLGSGPRHVGEATILAWAEVNQTVAIVDEEAGRTAGKRRGVDVHGTLWLVARAVTQQQLTLRSAGQLVDALRVAGSHLPCDGARFEEWATKHGLM